MILLVNYIRYILRHPCYGQKVDSYSKSLINSKSENFTYFPTKLLSQLLVTVNMTFPQNDKPCGQRHKDVAAILLQNRIN